MAQSLGQRMVRTAGIFQGVVALPVMLVMGETVFEHLWWWYSYTGVYYFIRAFFNALMAAAIMFIIFVQRHPIQSRKIRLYLEIAKSSCATAIWIWLLMDSIFGPDRGYYYPSPRPRTPRIVSAALSSIILLTLYYPTLVFAYQDKSDGGTLSEDGEGNSQRADEETPLLREQHEVR